MRAFRVVGGEIVGGALLVGAGDDFASLLGADDGERGLPEWAARVFPPLIVGLYVAAVLAASMSTIDSLLLLASSALTRDIYQQLWRPDLLDRPPTGLSRRVTCALAATALAVALTVSVTSPDGRSSGTPNSAGPGSPRHSARRSSWPSRGHATTYAAHSRTW